jgi:dipeptidyl aminopeptidase/acylaminoacyl peptidase
MRRITRSLILLALVASAAVFFLGARAAAGALQLHHVAVPDVCPCIEHVHCRDVRVVSGDGTALQAWYYEPDNANGGAILMLHGVGGNRGDVIGLGAVYEHAGYAVLTPDLRGHGKSGGLVTYGIQDEADIKAWVDWLQVQRGIKRLYGFGASLGASVLLESLTHEQRFRAVIAESAFSDFPSIANERIGRVAPYGLGWIAGPFVKSGIFWARLRYGVNLRQSSPLEGVRRTKTPVLIAHGLEDHLTSPRNSRELVAANPAVAVLWLVSGAGHANLWATDRRVFETRTLDWFSRH